MLPTINEEIATPTLALRASAGKSTVLRRGASGASAYGVLRDPRNDNRTLEEIATSGFDTPENTATQPSSQ